MRTPRRTTATAEVEVGQLLCGVTCGIHGPETDRILAFDDRRRKPEAQANYIYGLPMHAVLGRQLGEGSRVRVTVEVLKEKPLKHNPWLNPRKRP